MQVCLPVPLCYQNSVLLDNSRGGRDSGCQAPGRGWAPRARLREVWGAGDPCVPPLCSHGPCTGLRLPFPCHPGIAGASRHFTRLQARGCGFVALAASPGQCGQVTQQGGGCWGRRMRSCDCQCFADKSMGHLQTPKTQTSESQSKSSARPLPTLYSSQPLDQLVLFLSSSVDSSSLKVLGECKHRINNKGM